MFSCELASAEVRFSAVHHRHLHCSKVASNCVHCSKVLCSKKHFSYINYRHVHSCLEYLSLLNSVLYKADTLVKKYSYAHFSHVLNSHVYCNPIHCSYVHGSSYTAVTCTAVIYIIDQFIPVLKIEAWYNQL